MQANPPQETPTPETQEPVRRLYGHIIDINAVRQYCFVRCDNGKRYFLHANHLQGGVEAMKQDVYVFFTPLRTRAEGKHDRALDAVPAKPGHK